jgi:Protein of unknown function (DUF4246)
MSRVWKQCHELLDVWKTDDTPLSVDDHYQLLDWIDRTGKQASDRFVPSYENIIDPNLSVQFVGQYPHPETLNADVTRNGNETRLVNHNQERDSDCWTTDDPDGANVYYHPRFPTAPPLLPSRALELPSRRSVDYRWIAVDMKLRQDGSVRFMSEIPRHPRSAETEPLYNAITKLLEAGRGPLCQLRNWMKYSNLDADRSRTRTRDDDYLGSNRVGRRWDFDGDQHPTSFRRPDLPFSTYAKYRQGVDFQVVVKVQRVVVGPGGAYQGLWHDEGLHEKIIAVLVLYTNVAEELKGGEIQFAPKGDISVEFGHTRDIRDAWRKRIKQTVPVETGTCIFFSNFQTVHRVLEIKNESKEPQVREFLCLFIVDPLHRLPTATDLHQAMKIGDIVLTFLGHIRELRNLVMDYFGTSKDSTVFPSIAVAKQIRSILFQDQMKPKQNGTWMLYSTGNGDCKQVGWSANPVEFGKTPEQWSWSNALHGTDDEWIPSDDDDNHAENLAEYTRRTQLRDKQTTDF